MNTLLLMMLLLPVFQGGPAGDRAAGKTLWEGGNTQCRNCHGNVGQGGLGPDLAGRKLTVAQFSHSVREPWGIMPGYVASQISDKELTDLSAYFDSLPPVAQPAAWRFPVPADAPRGQQLLLSYGCGQCHGVTFNNPRMDLGVVGGDFEWFKRLVYEHSTEMPKYSADIGEELTTRVRMGNYDRHRVPEVVLQEIYNWAKDVGFRPGVSGELTAGVPAANGVTYTLNVKNHGLANKGLTAEEMTITLLVPAGNSVVSATGAGYAGVSRDEQAKSDVAVWRLARLGPRANQAYTITLAKPATAEANLRGDIKWAKPVVKTGPFDTVNIGPPPQAR